MSALDGWIDVCRTGEWEDVRRRQVSITEEVLDQLVRKFGAQDGVPVVIGHPETDAPAYAWVDRLRRVGDRLQAKLRDIAPAFRSAVESGRYASRSIGFTREGLVHIAFLGGRAPAVPGLAPTSFATASDSPATFLAAPTGRRENEVIPNHVIAARAREIMRNEGVSVSSRSAVDRARTEFSAARTARLADGGAQQPRMIPDRYKVRAIRVSSNSRRLSAREEPFMETLLAALFARPYNITVDFALVGETKVYDAATVFQKFLEGTLEELMPPAYSEHYGELARGRLSGPTRTPSSRALPPSAQIASEARILMAKSRSAGRMLGAVEAVDQVRARYASA